MDFAVRFYSGAPRAYLPAPVSALALAVLLLLGAAMPLCGQVAPPTGNTEPAQSHAGLPALTDPAKAPHTPPGILVQRGIVIGKGGNRDLHADIAYPANSAGPLSAVIFIHGGGWEGGDYHHSPIFQIAQQGYFVASIEYRLLGEAVWPAQIQDCKLGVRWLRANAAKFNVNPDRIGVWGESAGGHLAAAVGTMTGVPEYEGTGGYSGVSSAVQAVADFFGPTDFFETGVKATNVRQVEKLLGVRVGERPELWKAASPVAHVKAGDPPFLIIHGDADTTVPVDQSFRLNAALAAAGVPHELIVVKNGTHGFFPLPGTQIEPARSAIDQALSAFFARYLKTP